ncbi:hypothetical protein [Methylobacter sp. sgz302048]|uniref:hypothetical protein n=1 Tax=Methylobacter sp. sgz302048 TaxID=3455945 RepID=UPI003FA07229
MITSNACLQTIAKNEWAYQRKALRLISTANLHVGKSIWSDNFYAKFNLTDVSRKPETARSGPNLHMKAICGAEFYDILTPAALINECLPN